MKEKGPDSRRDPVSSAAARSDQRTGLLLLLAREAASHRLDDLIAYAIGRPLIPRLYIWRVGDRKLQFCTKTPFFLRISGFFTSHEKGMYRGLILW